MAKDTNPEEVVFNGKRFEIIEDLPGVGWYLYVTGDLGRERDYLESSPEILKQIAHEDFDVPLELWGS